MAIKSDYKSRKKRGEDIGRPSRRRAVMGWERRQYARSQQAQQPQSQVPPGWDLPTTTIPGSQPQLPGAEGEPQGEYGVYTPGTMMSRGGLPARSFYGKLNEFPNYWENPQNVIKWYDRAQADPTLELPEGMDRESLNGVYSYMQYRNGSTSRELWRYLPPEDPLQQMVREIPPPSAGYLTPNEASLYGVSQQQIAAQTPGGTSQTDYTAPDFDWTRLTVQQKQEILSRPDFSVSQVVAPGQQGLILSDSEFDFWGKARRGELPWWQPIAFSVLSNPKTTPLVQGAALTLMTGGKGAIFAVPMTLLGYGAQSENEAIRVSSETLLKPFIWGAQVTEQVAGFTSQQAEVFQQITQRPDEAADIAANFVRKTGGPVGLIRGFLSAQIGKRPTDPEALQGYAAWEANKSFYESLAGPEVWVLGENKKVPVPPGYSMEDARKRILDGESPEGVLADFTRVYGINGVATDFAIQSVADPLTVLPDALGVVRAEVSAGKARKFTIEAGRFKELGVLDAAKTEHVNMLEARAAIENAKATVFETAPGTTGLAVPFGEAGRKFRAIIEGGAISADQAKYLTSWERRVAGLNIDGTIKELGPISKTPTMIERMVSLQPKAKAKVFLEKYSTTVSSLFDWGKMTDATPREMVDVLKAAGNADMTTLKNAGAEFMNSPEAYTTIGAVRDVLPRLDEMVKTYETAAPNREIFWTVQAVLGDEPRKILTDFLDGDTRADWNRLVETLRQADAPEARALLQQIDSGVLTAEKLTEVFKPFKDGNVAIHPQEFSATIINTVSEHMRTWGKDYFGLRADNVWEDSLRLLKGAQSLLLLDLSSGAMINDFVNERVMMASTGTLGLTPDRIISKWADDFGLAPKDVDTWQQVEVARREGDVVGQLTRGTSAVGSVADALNKGRSYLLRPQASSRFNAAHAKQMYYKHTKTFWSNQWRVGKGFERMPAALEGRLREYGIEPNLVYNDLHGVLSTKQLDLLSQRATNANVHSFVDAAAQQLGRDPANVSAMLDQLGVLDDLKDRLSRADTPEKRQAAFDSIEDRMLENFDIKQAEGLRNFLEQKRNQIQTEGPAGVVQAFRDIRLDYYETGTLADRYWSDAYKGDNAALRRTAKEFASRKSDAAWRRTQARQAALLTAAIEGLGLDTDFKRGYIDYLSQQHNIYREYYQYKRNRIRQFYDELDAGLQPEWKQVEAELRERYKTDVDKPVLDIQRQMDSAFVDEFGRQYGDAGAAMAKAWTDKAFEAHQKINESNIAFRDFLANERNMPPEFTSTKDWHDAAWEARKPELRKLYLDFVKIDTEGAGNLYKGGEFGPGGEPTPTPEGPPPPTQTPPPTGGATTEANPFDEYYASRQAEADNLKSIWDVAESFSRMEPGNSSNYDRGYVQDNFALLGALKKIEYGGDPSIRNMQDAARKLTPDQVDAILQRRAEVKQQTIDAENAAREARLETVRQEAQARAAKRKKPENITITGAIKKHGGLEWDALSNFGEKDAKGFPPGTFTKRGKNRWSLDEMAQILADDGYPIDMNRPDDVGGIRQTVELIQRQQQGEDVFPVAHDYEAELVAREAEAAEAAKILEEDRAAQSLDKWEQDVTKAAEEGDFDQLAELASRLPEDAASQQTAGGENYNDFLSRVWNETEARIRDRNIAETKVRAEDAIRAQEQAGEKAMTRQLFRDQLRDAFGLIDEEAEAVVAMTDARAEAWARVEGRDAADWYNERLADVVRGGEGELYQLDTPAFQKWFGDSKVVDLEGNPLEVYHGTFADFQTFDRAKGNQEAHFGDAFYFTDDIGDVETYSRYSGPDPKNKIEQAMDRLSDVDDWYDYKDDLVESLNMSEDQVLDLIESGSIEDHITDEIRREIAVKQIGFENEGVVVPAYLKIENPLNLFDDGTRITYEYGFEPDDVADLIIDRAAEYPDEFDGRTDIPYDEAFEMAESHEYDWLAEKASYEPEIKFVDDAGNEFDLFQEMRDSSYRYDDIKIDDLIVEVHERLYPGDTISAKELFGLLRESENLAYAMDYDTGSLASGQYLKDLAQNLGYDGIKMDAFSSFGPRAERFGNIPGMEGVSEGTTHYLVFESEQIKSPFNRGTFDPNNPNILMQGEQLQPIARSMTPEEVGRYTQALLREADKLGDTTNIRQAIEAEGNFADRQAILDEVRKTRPEVADEYQSLVQQPEPVSAKGAVTFLDDGRAIISAFEKTDVSTVVHEIGHVFRRELSGDDLRTVEEWAGVSDGNWQREHEEKFARGFERYLAEGKAPTPKLVKVFDNFKTWLTEIYRNITGSQIDVKLSDDVRQVFDRLLAEEEQPKWLRELQSINQEQRQKRVQSFMEGLDMEAVQRAREMRQRLQEQGGGTLYQSDTPIYPPGGYEQATGYVDYNKILSDGFNDEVKPVMDAMREAAGRPTEEYAFTDMDLQTQAQMKTWLSDVRNNLANTKHQAKNYAEAMRDFALLDYNRQYGFDKTLSAFVPYEFYGTRSAANWLTRIADRPGWISNFLRLQNLHNTYQSQLPERTRNKFYVPMPFLPEWAGGGVFIDPTYQLYPFRQFTSPLESMKRDQEYLRNNAAYILRDMADDGTITQQAYQQAIDTQQGQAWENAIAQAKIDQGDNRNTAGDYFSMLLSPALYLTIPYYLATGKKSGQFGWPSGQLPITRFGQGIETAFKGTKLEWAGNIAGQLAKPERWAREQKGLNEFGEWGEYYIERQLVNMVAEGLVDPKEAERVMQEKKGPLYEQATERVKQELMLKVPGMAPLYGISHGATLDQIVGASITSLFPGGILPPGEMEYKGLKQEYGLAWDAYKAGNTKAISEFFDAHPEYSARLALRRDPQERMTQFLKSEIWDAYTALETTDRKQATAFLGPQFQDFLDSDSGVEFSTEQLTRWVRMLNGMVPETPETAPFLEQNVPQINYFAPEVTSITDRFFTERKEKFPHYYSLQATYYSLPYSERDKFLMQFPEYTRYRAWKDDKYDQYPDLIPVFNGEVFRRQDFTDWPPSLMMTIEQAAYTGDDLPSGARQLLGVVWDREGRPYGDLESWIENQIYPSVLNQAAQEFTQ